MEIRIPAVRIWIWLKRIRHRKGYGVHSPFAFNLITWVIHEKYPYYKYAGLDKIRKSLIDRKAKRYLNRPEIDRLLFRLVNRMQPDTIIETGTLTGLTTLYLAGGRENAVCHTFDEESGNEFTTEVLFKGKENIRYHKGNLLVSLIAVLSSVASVDFLYINEETPVELVFEACLEKVTENSLFIIQGIYRSERKKRWWQKIVADERTGITFDLYDVGLVFFDKRKIKQHYLVNF